MDLLERLLDETRDEIRHADNKASIVLAGAGIAIGAVIAGLIAGDVSLSNEPWFVWVLAGITASLLTTGIVSVGAAVFPRLGEPEAGRARYFREIAMYKGNLEGFRESLQKESSQDDRNHQQVLALSILVNTKYELTRKGMLFLVSGLSAGAITGLMSKV